MLPKGSAEILTVKEFCRGTGDGTEGKAMKEEKLHRDKMITGSQRRGEKERN